MISLLIMTIVSYAQKMTPQQERDFYQRAYDIINSYAKTTNLSKNDNATKFLELFESRDIMISNDLMGLSYEPVLSVSDYCRLLGEASGVKFIIMNVNKGGPIWYENGLWHMSILFEKNILFRNQCDTRFNAYEIFGKYYQLNMILVWNGKDDKCHIQEIKDIGDQLAFPENYRVLVRSNDLDDKLTLNKRTGDYIKFNNDGQLILRPDDVLYYNGVKVNEIQKEGSCDHRVVADYRVQSWRIRVNGALSLQDFNSLGKSDSIIVHDNNEKAFNVDIGYIFPTSSKLHFGIFAGVGMSINNLKMELTPAGKYKKTKEETDDDGDRFQRYYEVIGDHGIIQEMKATDITIPVYLDMEYEISYNLSIYADMGLKFQTSTGKMTLTGSYKMYGMYPDYGNLVIGENGDVSLNGFGSYNSIGIDDDGIKSSMTVDGIFGAGLRVNFNKSFALDAGVQYQVGSQSWKAEGENDLFSYSPEDGGRTNLLRKVESISHKSMKVSASIIYKF